jgi:hypothetical protein
VLNSLHFEVFIYDEGIFINKQDAYILICYVDDILVLYKDLAYIKSLKANINKYIELDKIGQITTFLGNDIYIDLLLF